jgi:hypothetical protein
MKAEEIERIKQGIVNAIAKAPGNLILRDLERSILTVEKYKAALETYGQHLRDCTMGSLKCTCGLESVKAD